MVAAAGSPSFLFGSSCPLQHTLTELRAYDLNRRGPLTLPVTLIDEFTELNQALTQMSARLAADYQRFQLIDHS
ncbi:hypothetical protein ACVWYF_004017 [Hymenobacter sp. UYAg731]